ncbi:MAG: D-2-hydroxyacid dehydrogenase [Gemmatimonadota bacterium]
MLGPFSPRRVVVGTGAHAAIIAALRACRPELEFRGAPHTEVTAVDLAWADTYVGFKRPPDAVSMGSVRWVHCTGAGVDSWLAPVELDRSILLTRTPESFGSAIAEWVVARVLAFQQQLTELAVAQREHRWAPRDIALVAGTRALVVGTGDVGGAVASRLTALGVEVSGVSRTGRGEHAAFRAVHPVSALPGLVAEAQWIVLTIPDTPATRGLFSLAVMERCRGAVLINAGRGSVVDEAALPDALAQGWLRGVALDVFAVEPLPPASPLWDHPRVLLSPHCSGRTTVEGAAGGFLECLESLERGQMPKWTVDRDRGY